MYLDNSCWDKSMRQVDYFLKYEAAAESKGERLWISNTMNMTLVLLGDTHSVTGPSMALNGLSQEGSCNGNLVSNIDIERLCDLQEVGSSGMQLGHGTSSHE
jgi:hypothetical protein